MNTAVFLETVFISECPYVQSGCFELIRCTVSDMHYLLGVWS